MIQAQICNFKNDVNSSIIRGQMSVLTGTISQDPADYFDEFGLLEWLAKYQRFSKIMIFEIYPTKLQSGSRVKSKLEI